MYYPTYKKFGERAFVTLDGEFAIVLADFKNNLLHLVTDPFATNHYGMVLRMVRLVASYESAVKSLGFRKVIKQDAANSYIQSRNKGTGQ